MKLSSTPLIPADAIQQRVLELAREISKDYAQLDAVLLCVLKGAAPFTMDLFHAIDPNPFTLDFIRAQSYVGTASSGSITLRYTPDEALTHRHVLLVEDILDTGRTLDVLVKHIQAENPASLKICTLLDKPSRRIIPATADYTGFTIDDHFVVGYGLDYNERYRELHAVYCLEEE